MGKTVLFVLDRLMVSGVTSIIAQQAAILTEAGYKVIILGAGGDLKSPEHFFPGCQVVGFEYPALDFWPVKNLLFFLRLRAQLGDIFSDAQVEVIHFSEVKSTLFSLLGATVWKKKKIITFYGARDLEGRSGQLRRLNLLSWFKFRMIKLAQLLVFMAMNRIVVLSNYSQRLVSHHFSSKLFSKITLINGFVADEEIGVIEKKQSNSNELILINFGRAEPRKGLEILLEAVKILRDKDFPTKTYIASPIGYLEWSRLLIKYEELDLYRSVHFLHSANKQRKTALLREADLFVMPSKYLETFGMTVIESLAKGVPVIGNNTGALPEILGKIDQNLLFGRTPASLAKQILWYADLTQEEKNALSRKCVAVAKKYYSASANKAKVLGLYFML